MKSSFQRVMPWALVMAVGYGLLFSGALLQADNSQNLSTNPPVIAPSPQLTPLVKEVLKLNEDGASQEVMRAYIEMSPNIRPTAADQQALKKGGIPRDLIELLIKGSAGCRVEGNSSQEAPVYSDTPVQTMAYETPLPPADYTSPGIYYGYPFSYGYGGFRPGLKPEMRHGNAIRSRAPRGLGPSPHIRLAERPVSSPVLTRPQGKASFRGQR